jgi:hypothetical protein
MDRATMVYIKPCPITKIFLETWCQPKSRPLFSFESTTTETTFSENSAFSRLVETVERPICHDPHWPPMPTKFPLDIPKFEGNPGKDPGDHVTTFHLWCSSNLLKDDSIQLCLFQHTLGATKWYIELDNSKYAYFNDLIWSS